MRVEVSGEYVCRLDGCEDGSIKEDDAACAASGTEVPAGGLSETMAGSADENSLDKSGAKAIHETYPA